MIEMKTLKIYEEDHRRLQAITKKNEPFADSFKRLLAEMPYIAPLKLAYGKYIEANEAFKHLETDNPTEKGAARSKAERTLEDLVRQVKHFFTHVEERSK